MKISERLYNANQSWNYESIVKVDEHKLRISIRRNAYDAQSHCKISRWDGTKWQFITSKPIEECKCSDASYVVKKVNIKLFQLDANDLIKEATQVICQLTIRGVITCPKKNKERLRLSFISIRKKMEI